MSDQKARSGLLTRVAGYVTLVSGLLLVACLAALMLVKSQVKNLDMALGYASNPLVLAAFALVLPLAVITLAGGIALGIGRRRDASDGVSRE